MRPDRKSMRLLGQKLSPLFLVVVVLTTATIPAIAQIPDSTSRINAIPGRVIPEELWRAGIYLGLSKNFYLADHIKGLPGVPSCCPDYTSGNGSGMGVSILAELPLDKKWRVGWRLSYASLGGELKTQQFEEVNADHDLVLATFEHTLAADITAIGLESYAGYQLMNNLKLMAGLRGDLLAGQGFRQEERLIDPEGITFENGSRIRMSYEGDIADASSLHLGLIGMLRYELEISEDHNWVLAPEAGGWYGLTKLVEGVPWKANGLRVGLSIQYIARDVPDLITDPLDVIVPIESRPGDASGSERDREREEEKVEKE